MFTSTLTDPLVHCGRHFGRTVYAFCNVKLLLANGLERFAQDEDDDAEGMTAKYVSFLSFSALIDCHQGAAGAIHLPSIAQHMPGIPRETFQCVAGGDLHHRRSGESSKSLFVTPH